MFRTQGNDPACTTVTSAPSRKASSASARPICPVDRVVRTRTSSKGSAHAPLVMRTRLPASGRPETARAAWRTIVSISATFAFPSSIRGATMSIPQERSRSRFSTTPGWRYMLSCIAGATTTGIPRPSAVVAKVVAGVSSIPAAILPMVFAVQGAMRRRSAAPPSPQ
ncbi:MAG: hypothetical protein BWX50_01144 [Euryarchaeota archaeon ADurb.Bin009]|nr:MAG: hypothetical protein BWX50_01144 [Euryarchaeota archaeon ADurb.Bin009]